MQKLNVFIFAYKLYNLEKVRIRNNIIILLSLLAAACNVDKRDVESPVSTPVEVTIRATQGGATRAGVIQDPVIEVGADLASAEATSEATPLATLDTRTELGTASDNELPIHWSWSDEDKSGDKIMVWAKPATDDAVGFTFAQTVFSLASFNYTYSSADFTATVAESMMKDYNYNYYAIYPVPTTVNDTSVTYTLPTTQTGDYDGAYDIMRGSATGAALVERTGEDTAVWNEPELQMNHLLHLMRIRVPAGKNLMDRPIKRLEITFPEAIVGGTVTFNPTNPESDPEWSGQSEKLTIEFADDNLLDAAGRDVWFFVKPTTISGQISFQAYDTAGVPAAVISTTVSKTLQAEHITPIALTIPGSQYPVTYVKITETANNLGEEWNTMTLSGATFVKPFTLETTNSLEVTPKTSKVYEVAIAAEPSAMQGKSIAASYDSPNAIVSNSIALPSTISNRQANVNNQVPYLLFEDFSRIVNEEESYGDNDYDRDGDDRNAPGKSLSQLSGWSAARFWAKQGVFRLNVRWQMVKFFLSFTTTHYGRLDSAPLSALKDNANVKLRVQFDAGANVHSSSNSGAKQGSFTHISLATHTNSSNPINGVGTGTLENGSLSDFGTTHYTSNAMTSAYGPDDFQNTYPTHTVEIGSATKTTRLCFYPSTTFSREGITNAEFNVYLDNIKVSIAQ